MRKNIIFAFSSLLLTFLVTLTGCGEKTTKPDQTEQVVAVADTLKGFDPKSVDEVMSKNITNFLVNDFLKNELEFLTANDRRFQFFPIDLNGDGKEEYFVRLMGSYFCGTGGCTVLLLDHESGVITKFSVMDGPIHVGTEMENNWLNLYVENNGSGRVLKFDGKKYPSNPSVAPTVSFKSMSFQLSFFDDASLPAYTYAY